MKRYATAPDPNPARVRTLLFARPPLEYVADTAETWVRKGFAGFLRPDIMSGWHIDVWEADGGQRVVGEDNPRLVACARANARLAEAGADENFMVIPFNRPLPDWFDDGAWENFRHGARFAAMAGFRGLALDDEYIEDTFGLDRYRDEDLDRLRTQVRARGRQLQLAMLAEFPDMVTMHLPESFSIMGELARDLFYGYLDVLADEEAPGGMHLLCETTYFMTQPDWVARYAYGLDRILRDTLDAPVADYWSRKCGIAVGQSPLGYLRFIRDPSGKRLGYGGRPEIYGDRILRAGEDKSGNYPAEVFRTTYAGARAASRRYTWVFSGGPAWWQMTDEERERYGGSEVDSIPVTSEFCEYVDVLTHPSVIDDPPFENIRRAVETGEPVDVLEGLGIPPVWWTVGPFLNRQGDGWDSVDIPETDPDLRDEVASTTYAGPVGTVRWRKRRTPPNGYVDLSRLVAGGTEIQAYAVTWAECETPTDGVLRFGSDDTAKVWQDGSLIHASNTERINMPDEDIVPVKLPAGHTQFMVKIGNYRGGYGFYFRITDEEGKELAGLRWRIEL